jgi:MFS family permease
LSDRLRLARPSVSYYLTDVLNSVGITSETIQTLYNGILQIFNMVIAVTAAMLCDKIGRRTLFLWSNTGMLISFIIWTICAAINHQNPENTAAGRAILGIIFLF